MTIQQEKAIETFLVRFSSEPGFLADLLVGSIAHGYSKPTSDIDIILVATDAEFAQRSIQNKLAFSIWDICDYEGGYVDCKVTSLPFLETVRKKGSDPARYAFKDARVLFSRIPELQNQLNDLTNYPLGEKSARRHRFLSQLLAWKWYLSQGLDKSSKYLITLSVQKITLFVCRIVLNENEKLFPYHKWLLAETERAPNKPKDLMVRLTQLMETPTFSIAQEISDVVFSSYGLSEKDVDWPNQFMADSELNWIDHEAPIEDV